MAIFQPLGRLEELCYSFIYAGYAAYSDGHIGQARHYQSKALQMGLEIEGFSPLIQTLPLAAILLADQGEKEQAIELYTLASQYPFVANSCWFEDVIGRHITAAAATLSPQAVATAQEQGRGRDLWETAAELMVELED